MAPKLDIIIVTPKKFDINKVVVNPPIKTVFKNKHSMVTSPLSYIGDNGKIGAFALQLPKAFCLGLEESKEQDSDRIKGYQFRYLMTSKDTIKKPTDDEKLIFTIQDQIQKKVYEEGKKFLKEDEELPEGESEKMPPNCRGCYMTGESAATKKKYPDYISRIIKKAYAQPNKQGTKIVNEEKPFGIYIKCAGFQGKDGKPIVTCKFYRNGGNTLINPKDMLTVWDNGVALKSMWGDIVPVVLYKAVFWGGHMQQPYCGSVQMELYEANYYPSNFSREHKRAIEIDENADQLDAAIENNGEGEGENDSTPAQDNPFKQPEKSEKVTPIDILNKAVENNLNIAGSSEGTTKKTTKKATKKEPEPVILEEGDDDAATTVVVEEEEEEVKKPAPKKTKKTTKKTKSAE